MLKIKFIFILLTLTKFVSTEDDEKYLKICVPEKYLGDCKDLLGRVKKYGPDIDCVSGRDRIDCLELLQKNEVDVVTVEPEDAYYAASIDVNGTFRIIGELRYDKNDEFEDEDQILIRKSSTTKSLNDLKGLKSCHPHFNSYYGYKILVVILKRHGLIEVSKDSSIPALERELKALSEFFEQSCIVGPYSDDENVDQEWKKKYSNLCQLCQNPVGCNQNDKYGNFDGAIKCLINGEGDIAFTRRSEIQKYFGLTKEEGNKNVNIDDYELLCEDGSRQPINGTGCSLAKRPNRAYISTTNVTDDFNLLSTLLIHLQTFTKNGVDHGNSNVAKNLLIEDGHEFHEHDDALTLEVYLGNFKDYIERDESYTYKPKLCVTTDIELQKCEILTKVAFDSEIRPGLKCYLSEEGNCAADVANDKAHIAFVPGYNWTIVENEFKNIERVAYENVDFAAAYIAMFKALKETDEVEKYVIKFDNSDKRAHKAACLLHLSLGGTQDCDKLDGNITDTEDYIHVVKAAERHDFGRDKVLLCLDKTRSHVGYFHYCNLDLYYQNAMYINKNKSQAEIDSFKHAITTIGTMFGYNGLYTHVFDIYAQFKGNNDVLFNDNVVNFDGSEDFDHFDDKYHDLIMKVLKYDWRDEEDSTVEND